MNELATSDGYAVLTEPSTLQIQRLLPGPIERVWNYLTESHLRRRWFAAGDMKLEIGAPVELVWRNDELTDPPGQRPAGASGENRMQSRITELESLRKLAIAWGADGSVSFELTPQGDNVLLTIVHRGVPDRASLLNFAPGWHTHLDVLAARLGDKQPEPFWDAIARLKHDYAERLPA
ncbi:MAG: SRPBCC family protein [Sphingomonas sp.]|uniref:SRPBCC family protein n=1 Tax=Sphingomonas sp. TaxID=28214 RepID=UPI0017FF8034|nr:SRPBCC family protein [Sphingomonas sp.]MBA3667913.1 SRPBCC family protein [Sphingomonas sp.]